VLCCPLLSSPAHFHDQQSDRPPSDHDWKHGEWIFLVNLAMWSEIPVSATVLIATCILFVRFKEPRFLFKSSFSTIGNMHPLHSFKGPMHYHITDMLIFFIFTFKKKISKKQTWMRKLSLIATQQANGKFQKIFSAPYLINVTHSIVYSAHCLICHSEESLE